MSFSQTTIQDVSIRRRDAELVVSWVSYAPLGTTFQLYKNRQLVWHGQARSAVVHYPASQARYEVGTVLASEASHDLSASLPAVPGGGARATLTWLGGTYLDPDIAGFNVYMGTVAGGAVNYAAPVGVVAAYAQGLVTDGWGMGGWGQGGWGHAAASYSWTSKPIAAGVWNVAVKPFDVAGNEGAAQTGTAAVAGPPQPPALGTNGKRVGYTYSRGTPGGWGTGGWGMGGWNTGAGWGSGGWGVGGWGVGEGDGLPLVTLTWNASPGF